MRIATSYYLFKRIVAACKLKSSPVFRGPYMEAKEKLNLFFALWREKKKKKGFVLVLWAPCAKRRWFREFHACLYHALREWWDLWTWTYYPLDLFLFSFVYALKIICYLMMDSHFHLENLDIFSLWKNDFFFFFYFYFFLHFNSVASELPNGH